MVKNLPLGIQSFRKIITGDYVYIDKTQYIYDLLVSSKHYFISRPRRFGKSLLLDTIAEVFMGDRELFKGLWIYDSDYVFEKHPVLRLDMSNIANDSPDVLKNELSNVLKRCAKKEDIEIDDSSPYAAFRILIEELRDKYNRSVAVLIDEYYKPILDHLHNVDIAEANRAVLGGFYGILKSMDPYLKFTFITGVTKFTKTSIFSGLNNLYDLTLDRKYANICGIPVEALNMYFDEHIEDIAIQKGVDFKEHISDEILAWYDGYSWDGENRVINPYSLISFFMRKSFESFWYASGTPSFLINILKNKPTSFLSLQNPEIRERTLDSFDIKKIGVTSLLFQTGYLTVKKTLPDIRPTVYVLEIPNLEVREALYMNIIAEFTEQDEDFAETAYMRIKESLKNGNLQYMLETLRGLFASIHYQLHIDRESYYHSILYAVMSILGFDIDAEVSTSKGRIDAVLELADIVYVMEFIYMDCEPDAKQETKRKIFDEALEVGMKQIKDRGYIDRFAGSGKKVCQAAFAFLGRDNIEMRTVML